MSIQNIKHVWGRSQEEESEVSISTPNIKIWSGVTIGRGPSVFIFTLDKLNKYFIK